MAEPVGLDAIHQIVRNCTEERAGIDVPSSDVTIESLGMDALDQAEWVADVGDALNIFLDEEVMLACETFGDVLDYVARCCE